MQRRGFISFIALMLCLLCLACQMAPAQVAVVVMNVTTPTPTPQTVHISAPRQTPVPTAAAIPTPAPSPVPTLTPEPTADPTPEPTPEPEATARTTPKATATPKPTAKVTATPKPTATPRPAVTPRPTEDNEVIRPPSLVQGAPVVIETPRPTAAPAGEVLLPDGFSVDSGASYSAEEVVLAAKTAYFEARGNGEEAYRAVICVILNRVESTKFGGKVTSVKTEVYRKSQFSVVKNSKFETTVPPDDVIGYANDVLNNGNRSIPTDVFFFRAGRTDKTWGTKKFYMNIGGNDFYYGG